MSYFLLLIFRPKFRVCATNLGQSFDTRRAEEESSVPAKVVALKLELDLSGVAVLH